MYTYTSNVASVITFNHGTVIGWLSAAVPNFISGKTPLNDGNLSLNEVTLLASTLHIGALVGVLLWGAIASCFGSRVALICLAPSHSVSFNY